MISKMVAKLNDDRILHMAYYAESKGWTAQIKDMESLHSRFREYKRLVKNKEFKIDDLENDIYNKYGIVDESGDSQHTVDFLKTMLGNVQESE